MGKLNINSLGTILLMGWAVCHGQQKSTGPVINEFGPVYKIENADFQVDLNQDFKAVFDVMESPESHEMINPAIETAARFLNMHAQAGVLVNRLKVALVIHNKASKDIISHTAYLQKFGRENPNLKLIQAIMDAGGQVIMCGQSSISRGFPKEEFIPGVQLSLSAMTALIQLQNDNYQLIKF